MSSCHIIKDELRSVFQVKAFSIELSPSVIKYEESEVWKEKQRKVEERLWASMTRRKPTRGE